MSPPPVDLIRAEAFRLGSISFDRYLELALYGPDGFFTRGRGAGRADRDFVTSPQIGPLFGALVARAIDREWRALGEPDPFVVIEAGAGNGRLACEVLRAGPECAPSLRYVLVEMSAALREEQRELLRIEPPDEALGAFVRHERDEVPEPVERVGPIVTSLAVLPAVPLDGVLLANELLDNLPFALAEWDGERWHEVRVGPDLQPVFVPLADPERVEMFGSPPPRTRVPIPVALNAWFAEAARTLRRGTAILIDYCVTAEQLVARNNDWLRTYRDHQRGRDPFAAPGDIDITADVVLEHVAAAARAVGFAEPTVTSQADWLRDLGIDELVADGNRIWAERASIGDLEALEARSRATQAAALTDQTGEATLGNFSVLCAGRHPAGPKRSDDAQGRLR